MLESPAKWEVVAQFASIVMGAKEEAKRERQPLQGVAPSHRWRRGKAIRAHP